MRASRWIQRVVAQLLVGLMGIVSPVSSMQAKGLEAGALLSSVETGLCTTDKTFAVAIHGGAVFSRGNHDLQLSYARRVLHEARAVLAAGARAMDVVEAVIVSMEDSGHFNAGKGSIANKAGVIEMDASVMEGRHLDAGAVASVKGVRNPISAARLVMEKSRHVMLVGPDADRFVEEQGGSVVDATHFYYGGRNFANVPLPTDIEIVPPGDAIASGKAALSGGWAGVFQGEWNHVLVVETVHADGAAVVYSLGPHPLLGEGQFVRLDAVFVDDGLKVTEPSTLGGYTTIYRLNADGSLVAKTSAPGEPPQEMTLRRYSVPGTGHDGGTVGAAIRDRCGDLAAGTSTGGFGSKTPGRVGDSPIIGAGTYANNETAAVSATGHGEFFIRHVVAHAISAAMKYQNLSLKDAAEGIIRGELAGRGLRGGVVAVDKNGNISMPFNTEGMVRGATTDVLAPTVEVY